MHASSGVIDLVHGEDPVVVAGSATLLNQTVPVALPACRSSRGGASVGPDICTRVLSEGVARPKDCTGTGQRSKAAA